MINTQPNALVELRNREFVTYDVEGGKYDYLDPVGGKHRHKDSYGTAVFEGGSTEVTQLEDGRLVVVVNEIRPHCARLAINYEIMYGNQKTRRIDDGLEFRPSVPYEEAYLMSREHPNEFGIKIPVLEKGMRTGAISISEATDLTIQMLEKNLELGFLVRYLRPIAGIGPGGMGVSTSTTNLPEFTLHGQWWPREYMGPGVFENGMKIFVYEDPVVAELRGSTDYAKAAANYGGKRTPLKNNANRLGYNDALLIGRDRRGQDIVTELTSANIAIVKDGWLITPALNFMILPGITRYNMLEAGRLLAADLGLKGVLEEPITLNDLLDADEAMAWGTAAKVTPIVGVGVKRKGAKEIEDLPIGDRKPGKVTRSLQAIYHFLERGSAFVIDRDNGTTHKEDRFVDRAIGITVPEKSREKILTQAEGLPGQKYDTRFRAPRGEEQAGLRKLKMVA
ncbi:aminotransferase class IV family protein [Candidatus Micrarchaeota archaeon]|nr:aminotransferase class IV family protein [Candidatus Micrarchaeota archaeon]